MPVIFGVRTCKLNDDQFAFFTRLVETTGPSGYEWNTQAVWRDRVKGVAESVTTDRMGNSVATLNSAGSPRVMVEAHVDEIGFIIKYIDDNGYLYFSPIGGFDPSTLPGNRVRIMGHGGDVLGVIGRTPTHIISDEERKKAPELKTMWIDIGVSSRAEAENLVRMGDAGGRAGLVERLQGNVVAANSLDDRMGTYIVAEVFRSLAQNAPSAAVFASSCVQEEIGLRGAGATTYGVNPDVGIAIDVTWTTDHPNVNVSEFGPKSVGKGPLIALGAANNPKVVDLLIKAAEAEGVPYQIEADATGRGTDEYVMQTVRAGVATGLISIPTRYLHTSSEVLSTDDIDAAVALITRFVQDLPANPDLTP